MPQSLITSAPRLLLFSALIALALWPLAGLPALRGRSPPPLPSCARRWPWSGTFHKDSPPYWRPIPSQCALPSRPKSELVRCLAGRTVYVMGNSVGRGFFYELSRVLTDETNIAAREEQKQSCEKTNTLVNGSAAHMLKASSCTAELPSVNVNAAFMWRQWMWDTPRLLPGNHVCADMCGSGPPDTCMARFLGDATERDILIVNMGLITSDDGAIDVMVRGGEAMNTSSPLNNGESPVRGDWPWWKSQTLDFLHALPALTRIPLARTFLATTTNILDDAKINSRVAVTNAVAAPLFLAAGARVIDMNSVARGQDALYEDVTHIPGPLSQALWYAVIAEVCP